MEYQQKVIDVYTKMSKERIDWKLINCVEDGRLLSIEEIHERVMEIVRG